TLPTLYPYTTLFRSPYLGVAMRFKDEETHNQQAEHDGSDRGYVLKGVAADRQHAHYNAQYLGDHCHENGAKNAAQDGPHSANNRSEEHTSELQSRED